MAASDARPIPWKNTAFRYTFAIIDADGDLVTGATGLDSEVSLDGGTFADCTNEATEIATSSGMYYLDLTASEMNASTVALIIKTSSSGAKTTPVVLYPATDSDMRANVVQISGDATAADNLEAAADGTGYNLGGGSIVVASVSALANNVITASAIATAAFTAAKFAAGAIDATVIADGAIDANTFATDALTANAFAASAVTEIQSGLATSANQTSILSAISAVQADTDNIQTRLPAALVSGRIECYVGAFADASLGQVVFADNAITNRVVADGFISLAKVADSTLSAAKFAGSAITESVMAAGAISARVLATDAAGEIADAVWDETQADHVTAGSTGANQNLLSTISANVTTALGRIGAFTGSGINTVLGFLKAMMRSDSAITPSDVGGTFDNQTDSLQAIADAGGGGGGGGSTDWTSNERTAMRAILGIPASGTTPDTPSTGVLAAIKAKTDALGATSVTITAPVLSTGQIQIVRGDSYATADGRQLDFVNAAGTWPSLSGASVAFTATRTSSAGTTTTLGPISGSVVTATGANQTVRFELTAAQTAIAAAEQPNDLYDYDVQATLSSGRVVTLRRGKLTVLQDVSA